MVKPLSGALLAEKMANGTLTNEEQMQLMHKEKNQKKLQVYLQSKKKRIYNKVKNLHVAMQSKQKKQDVYKQDFLNMIFSNQHLLNL